MFPMAGSLFAFIVSLWGKALLEELVGQYASLGEAPNCLSHFQVNVSDVYLVDKVIMLNDPWRKRGKGMHMYLYQSRGAKKVEFLYIGAHIYLAPGVLSTLFPWSFEVVMSAIHVVSSPG